MTTYLKAMRPFQWCKNALIFLPLILAHAFTWQDAVIDLAGFIALSLLASAVYLVNDVCDKSDDKNHPLKRHRAIASGQINVTSALVVALCLGVGSFIFSAVFIPQAIKVLVCYLGLSFVYTFVLKEWLLYDVFCLASLYLIRVILGGVLINVTLSPWFLGFILFLFLGLAFAKRASELYYLVYKHQRKPRRRAYIKKDYLAVASFGIAVSFLSVVVLSLYISSPDARVLYTNILPLMVLPPILLFWLCRLWIVTLRGELEQDPVQFAMTEPLSYGCAVLVVVLFLMAV